MKFFSKKNTAFILVFSLFLGLFLVNIHEAKAQFGFLTDVGKDILQGIFNILLALARLFAGLIGGIFDKILGFGFDQSLMGREGPIYKAWTITRDIVNMFFILGLVVIAFATILRIETYGMKALLPKLIMVALLINFSYLACGIMIDAANVATNYFRDQIKTKTSETETGTEPRVNEVGLVIFDKLGVQKSITQTEGQSVALSYSDPEMTTILNTAFSAAIIFVAGFVLLIGAVLMFLRIGALWTLIILVPFAWFFSIFPALKTHSSKWWSEFFKWAFFAPVYVFFIYLVLKIAGTIQSLAATNTSPQTLQDMGLTEMTSNWDLFFVYVFLVILLMSAPSVAMAMGIKAAGVVTSTAKGVFKGAAKLPLKLQKAAATMAPPAWMEKGVPPLAKLVRGVQKTAAYTSLEFWKKAMEARKAERRRKARVGYIIGKQQDILNRVYSLFSEKTNFAEQAEQFEVAEKKKDVEAETKRVGPRLIAKLEEAIKQKDVLTYKACMELLQEQGDTNDAMMSDRGLFDNLKFDDKYALNKLKGQNVNNEKDRRFSNLGFKHGTIQQMRRMGLSDKQIAPFLGKLQEIGLQAGYFGLYGMAKTDDKGNMIIASDEEQIKVAAAKIKVLTARLRTSKMHGSSVGMQGVDENGQYKFAGRDDVSDAMLDTFTLADVDKTNMEYVRPDTQTLIDQAYEKGALKEISPTADALGKKIHEAITGIPKKVKKEVEKEVKKTKEEVEKEVKKTKEEVEKELEEKGFKV